MEMLKKHRQHLQGFLLRHGRAFPGKTHWTKTHLAWIRSLQFEHPAHRILIQESLESIRESGERLIRVEQQITTLLPSWSLAPVVHAMQAMRGVSEVSAVILAAEIGDFRRFSHPRQFVSYLGLAPSEHSSGKHIVRGPITKAGTAHGRRVLIEGAWAYRQPARVSNYMATRQADVAKDALDIGWKAQVRLCHRFRAMRARGKHHNVVVTAVAREMACFIWAIARTVAVPSEVAMAS
jgi:transposase